MYHKRFRGFRDARRQLRVLHRSRRLGAVELHAADAEHRQDRDGEHDDAHAAEPLQQLAVEQYRRRQVSMPTMTVAPVVVRPDRDSKTASGMRTSSGPSTSMNGIAPLVPSTTQNSDDDDEAVAQLHVAVDLAHRVATCSNQADGEYDGPMPIGERGTAAPSRVQCAMTSGGNNVRLNIDSSRPRIFWMT